MKEEEKRNVAMQETAQETAEVTETTAMETTEATETTFYSILAFGSLLLAGIAKICGCLVGDMTFGLEIVLGSSASFADWSADKSTEPFNVVALLALGSFVVFFVLFLFASSREKVTDEEATESSSEGASESSTEDVAETSTDSSTEDVAETSTEETTKSATIRLFLYSLIAGIFFKVLAWIFLIPILDVFAYTGFAFSIWYFIIFLTCD